MAWRSGRTTPPRGGRLVAVAPVAVARRGVHRPASRDEALALFLSAVATLQEAGIPVKMWNDESGAHLVLPTYRWRPVRVRRHDPAPQRRLAADNTHGYANKECHAARDRKHSGSGEPRPEARPLLHPVR